MVRLARAGVRALGAPLSTSDPPGPADAIVILGAPIGGDGRLSALAEERVRVGVDLWKRGLAPVIAVVGGHCPRGFEGTPAETEGMARWVHALGVPRSAILVDRTSTSTFTNAARAAEMLLPDGRHRVWLVTQPFHTRRARYYFRRAGFVPLAWPIEDSIERRAPRAALRWILREYAAWALVPLRAGGFSRPR